MSGQNIKMERKIELKEICIKYRTFSLILVYDISHKTSTSPKSLHIRFDKIPYRPLLR